VRVHRAGFGSPNSLVVHVTAGSAAAHDVVLTPLGSRPVSVDALAGGSKILAAGFNAGLLLPSALPDPEESPTDASADADHDHSELAWRLRHLRRSVLQESLERVVLDPAEEDDVDGAASTFFGRAMTAPARAAAALFSDVPFTDR